LAADRTKRKKATRPPLKDVDEEISALFEQWLVAFEKTQSAKDDDDSAAEVAKIESRIAATPAEGLRGIVVKLGLQRFMHEHADAASELAASAYADLIRLTDHDPASEIRATLRSSDRH
jgi:hypothetical protein